MSLSLYKQYLAIVFFVLVAHCSIFDIFLIANIVKAFIMTQVFLKKLPAINFILYFFSPVR